ncbi:MAG: 50S ribosomal protein L11 methyltransferase [Chthonomonadales bacterium]
MIAQAAEPQRSADDAAPSPQWLEVTVEAAANSVEAAVAALLEAGSPGIATTATEPHRLVASFHTRSSAEEALKILEDAFQAIEAAGLPRPTVVGSRWLDEADWANAWKRNYRPLRVGRNIVIKPSWETYQAQPQEVVIELDPGMAFGTGSHPTTRMCLEALEDHVMPGDTVADIGTGSGILAMASALLGARHVYATDIDALPRQVAQQNVAAAGLTNRISVLEPNAFYQTAVDCRIVVANILADTIITLIPNVAAMLRPNGLFLASGIVHDQLDGVIQALNDAGFLVLEVREDDVWRAILAERAGVPHTE